MDKFNYIDMIRQQITRVMLCQRKMRNWAKTYRAYQGGADFTLSDIKALGRNAITQPSRCLSKQKNILDLLIVEFGTQAAALAVIDGVFSSFHGGLIVRSEVTTKLNELKVHEDAIRTGVNSGGWTMDDVALYIETNLTDDEALSAQPEEPTWIQPNVDGVFV